MGEDFVKLWADQKELAVLHSKIPTMYRHEISKITAQLCIAIGRGHLLVPKDTRFSCYPHGWKLSMRDFAWMRRACRSVDKKLVEDGLSQTILTLPLPQQQAILLTWFDRFLNKGDDCPNIQRAFEWRFARIGSSEYAMPGWGREGLHYMIQVCLIACQGQRGKKKCLFVVRIEDRYPGRTPTISAIPIFDYDALQELRYQLDQQMSCCVVTWCKAIS
ncbi:BTB/POZ domain-containing protein [Vitis vinifera]|uniref:BTB/POZ domain-containing protein n=1 Tax=Vitis vinifera TaxID=29760 RepID=A0A438G170_VITVI|nr:BTB/POZ domain-containing protein [Vitis vinifera]